MNLSEQKTQTEINLAAAVSAGLYQDVNEALQEAVKTWLAVKPNIRLEIAIELFKNRDVTLERAAEIAGINRWLFQDILTQRGIKIMVEADSKENIAKAVEEIKENFL
jgi:predicted HTH domain antitoxin